MMPTLLNLLGLAFWLGALGGCVLSKGALHDNNGLLAFLIGTVMIVGAAIIQELRKTAMPQGRRAEQPPPAAPAPPPATKYNIPPFNKPKA